MGSGDGHDVVAKLLFVLFGAALIYLSKVNAGMVDSRNTLSFHQQQAEGGQH